MMVMNAPPDSRRPQQPSYPPAGRLFCPIKNPLRGRVIDTEGRVHMSMYDSSEEKNKRQAPSEKHLEDYLWAHPEFFGVYDEDIPQVNIQAGDPLLTPMWRQYHLPSGKVDMVFQDRCIHIIELKRGAIDALAVVQIIRYMSDMRRLWNSLVWDISQTKPPFWEQISRHDIINGSLYDQIVVGILVGHSVKDENLYLACAEANIEIVLYEYDGQNYRQNNTYTGDPIPLTDWLKRQDDTDHQLIQSPIGRLFKEKIQRRLHDLGKASQPFDAVKSASEFVAKLLKDRTD